MKNAFKRTEQKTVLFPQNIKFTNPKCQDKVVSDLLDTMKKVSPQTVMTIGFGVTALVVGLSKLIDEIE